MKTNLAFLALILAAALAALAAWWILEAPGHADAPDLKDIIPAL